MSKIFLYLTESTKAICFPRITHRAIFLVTRLSAISSSDTTITLLLLECGLDLWIVPGAVLVNDGLWKLFTADPIVKVVALQSASVVREERVLDVADDGRLSPNVDVVIGAPNRRLVGRFVYLSLQHFWVQSNICITVGFSFGILTNIYFCIFVFSVNNIFVPV